jgi:hypothetical protein
VSSSPEGVKQVAFQSASSTAAWRFPYVLLVPGITAWDPQVDEVVIGMTPDAVEWDDYGRRSRGFPPGSGSWDTAPFWRASSDDGDGVVTLVDPNKIDIVVPHTVMQQLGPGGVQIGIQYRTKDSGERATLLVGRLPLIWGVV